MSRITNVGRGRRGTRVDEIPRIAAARMFLADYDEHPELPKLFRVWEPCAGKNH